MGEMQKMDARQRKAIEHSRGVRTRSEIKVRDGVEWQ